MEFESFHTFSFNKDKKGGHTMQFKLKEDDILDFLELNFPDQTFEKGRLLVGQNKKNLWMFII